MPPFNHFSEPLAVERGVNTHFLQLCACHTCKQFTINVLLLGEWDEVEYTVMLSTVKKVYTALLQYY